MGITALLPLLKSIMTPIHIKDLEGCTVAVDTYSWLHKGALSCSRELCKGIPTTRHIEYCMHRVNLLRHYGVKPFLVFDGGFLPMKNEQENKRARARKENLARAVEHESNGNSTAAYECYQKAVDISPSIAHELIQVLRNEGISYVVAPYEADAQMTFLAASKQVDAVITEDSDLIPFGCPRIIFKMDKFGQGVQFQYSMLQQNKDLNFVGFTKQMLLEMCILSGCDYLQSLPGMGLKRAHALIKKFRSFDKAIKHLKYNTVIVPPLYEESFRKAIMTFQHQRVYNPMTEDIVHLADLLDTFDGDLDFLGPLIPQEIAKSIAKGDADPFTQLPFKEEGINPSCLENTLHPEKYKSERKKLDLPVQKNVLTKYFCFASLEAKRNFRAPRISPKQSSPDCDLSSGPSIHGLEEATDHMHSSPGFLAVSKNVDTAASTRGLDEDNFSTEPSETSNSQHRVMRKDKKGQKHILLQQSNHSVHKPCLTLHMQRDCNDLAYSSKIKTQDKKVVVRSRFFQKKTVNEDRNENGRDRSVLQDDVTMQTRQKNSPMSKNNDISSPSMKRETSPDDDVLLENVNPISMHIDASEAVSTKNFMHQSDEHLVDFDDHVAQLDNTLSETKTEGKFGSNISHLGNYSAIAEKSMEKFISVISSFRCNPSGSRASGLRAPLKDVQNNCSNRSTPTPNLDFSQYAYVSKRQKTGVAFRRCPK